MVREALRRGRGALAGRRAPARLRLRDPSHARQAPAGRRADPPRGGLSRRGDRGGALPRRASRDAAGHPAEEDVVRVRRAVRIRACLRSRASDRDRRPRAEVGQEEAEAAVVRGRRAQGRGVCRRGRPRSRARRPHSERRRGDAADRFPSSVCAPPIRLPDVQLDRASTRRSTSSSLFHHPHDARSHPVPGRSRTTTPAS